MNTVLIALLGATAMLAIAGYLVLRARSGQEELLHWLRCPACNQKLRYPARKVGGEGVCPRCKRRLTLPATPRSLSKPVSSYRVGERLALPRKTA